MTLETTKIPYADLLARWGVTQQSDQHSLRITVPPIPSIRYLPRGLQLSILFIGFTASVFVVAAFQAFWIRKRASDDFVAFAVNAGIHSLAELTLLVIARQRLRYRMLIEVTSTHLNITRMWRSRASSIRSIPRTAIGVVKRNRDNGKLTIQITGIELFEIFVSPNPDVTEWVAHTISSALAEIPVSVSAEPPPTAREMQHAGPLPRGSVRTLLLCLAGFIAIVGLIMVFMGQPWTSMSLFAFLIASIPAGIAMGTQDKEVWPL